MSNINDTVMPIVGKIKKKASDPQLKHHINLLEDNLKSITEPFARKLSSRYLDLTSSEIEVANHVKQGRSSKQIADMLNVTAKTVDLVTLEGVERNGRGRRRAEYSACASTW